MAAKSKVDRWLVQDTYSMRVFWSDHEPTKADLGVWRLIALGLENGQVVWK